MYLDYPCRYMYLACTPHVSCISDTYLSGYIWDTRIPICILEVSRMYPSCILEPLQIHLSRMYPWLFLHVSTCMYPACILEPLQIHVSRMDPACISHVSFMYPDCILKCRHDASKIHVSWFCISVYLDVSWWRVQDTCILMYLDMYPVWHQGSA